MDRLDQLMGYDYGYPPTGEPRRRSPLPRADVVEWLMFVVGIVKWVIAIQK